MGRSAGCVVYADGERRFFMHCETTGESFPALFETAAAVAAAHGAGHRLPAPAVGADDRVEVVQIARGSSLEAPDSEGWRFTHHGLATRSLLLTPRSAEHGPNYVLQTLAGVTHVATEISGGFEGRYHTALCDLKRGRGRAPFRPEAEEILLAAGFEQAHSLCQDCQSVLLDRPVAPKPP